MILGPSILGLESSAATENLLATNRQQTGRQEAVAPTMKQKGQANINMIRGRHRVGFLGRPFD